MQLAAMGVRRKICGGGKVDILLPFPVAEDTMQIVVHKALYPFYIAKKMPYVTASVTKIAILWQECFFSHSIKLCDLLRSAVTVLLHYLPEISAFNSEKRQNRLPTGLHQKNTPTLVTKSRKCRIVNTRWIGYFITIC